MVESAPNRIVISNMMTTYGGIEPTGLPPTTTGQSYDMYSVSQAPTAHPAMPPTSVNMRTGLTGWSSASSSSWRGTGCAVGAWLTLRSEEHTSELQSHLNIVCR